VNYSRVRDGYGGDGIIIVGGGDKIIIYIFFTSFSYLLGIIADGSARSQCCLATAQFT